MLENSIAWFEISVARQEIGASTLFVSYRSAAPEMSEGLDGVRHRRHAADKRACPGTIGLPVPGVEVLLLDEQRRPVPDGEIGELFARSELTVEGYHANDAATRESLYGDAFSVGDLAVRDPRGYLKLVGRKTDMVISGGMNVYPAEIEAALAAHPAIREAAVIGVPDDKWGESLVAFVAPRDGQAEPDDEELVAFLKKSLASYKVPRRFERVAILPRNPTGKTLKNAPFAGHPARLIFFFASRDTPSRTTGFQDRFQLLRGSSRSWVAPIPRSERARPPSHRPGRERHLPQSRA